LHPPELPLWDGTGQKRQYFDVTDFGKMWRVRAYPQTDGSIVFASEIAPFSAKSRKLPKLRYPADFHILDHEDIASVIEYCAVRRNEFPRDKIRAVFGSPNSSRIAALAVTQVRDDFVVFVQQGHAGLQVGHDNDALVLVEMARRTRTSDNIDRLVIQRITHDPVVAAIRDQ